MTALQITRADGILTVQDMGRPGHLAQGLSRGGAMDRRALLEGAALLNTKSPLAAIEMAGAGGEFSVTAPTRIALTGAPMAATLDDAPLRWNASHLVTPGQRLRIGGAQSGTYSYLTPAGGIATEPWLGSRAAHLSIGIGGALRAGDTLPVGDDPEPDRPSHGLPPEPRFDGGTIRVIDGPHTVLFSDAVLDAFYATAFRRGPRGNRQGLQLVAEARFGTEHAKGLASDMIGPGDVQMTGDGVPYVLMAECQTVGGYPRIGTVIPADLPRVAQAAPGAVLRPRRVTLDEALATARSEADELRDLSGRCTPLVRDPAAIRDLLSYQLVSGMVRGDEFDATWPHST
ncbi:biotin-dependent carboxyltransferase family protein [Sagittula salina]|uniref:Biotin-dependent carboxyltransferase n=1 Tax=Sagittula salina TaxID=2820268 RepID=A0A940MN40_9RHOB|nr:biotin-dependent carboxyltransferase family protein [Sagittula salina]MBP0481696.1 biotin-dependent carboxyltransferase [Sagittula salina]